MKKVALITGASGFLGQHLLKELQLRNADDFAEIRLLDKDEFTPFLEFPRKVPVKFFHEDLLELEKFEEYLSNCDVVFHLAAEKYDWKLYPNCERYWRNNLQATELLLRRTKDVCPKALFVFASDALANLPPGDNFGHPEIVQMEEPDSGRYLLGEYGRSKFKAEQAVRRFCCENELKSIVVRPTLLYGEGDSTIIPGVLEFCRNYGGMLPQIGCGNGGLFQLTYAGNAAACLIKAYFQLANRPDDFDGHVFYCAEEGQVVQFYDFVKEYILAAGYKVSPIWINYYMAAVCAQLYEKGSYALNWLLPNVQVGRRLPTSTLVRSLGAFCLGFSTYKTRIFLDFLPPYSRRPAMADSLDWWKKKLQQEQATA